MRLSHKIAKVFLFILPFTLIIAESPVCARAGSQTALMNRVNKAFRRDNRLNGAYCYTAAPGVIVLHGTVFDTADRELAESTARQVRGVKQVINGLLTTTGDWQAEQARINDMLALNGFTDLTVRVIGSQAFCLVRPLATPSSNALSA